MSIIPPACEDKDIFHIDSRSSSLFAVKERTTLNYWQCENVTDVPILLGHCEHKKCCFYKLCKEQCTWMSSITVVWSISKFELAAWKSKKVQTEHKRSNLQMAGCVLDPQVDRNYYLYVLAFRFRECNNITSLQPHPSVVIVNIYIVWTIDTSIQIITERTEKISVCSIVFYWVKGDKTAPKWPKWYKARRRENLINQKNQRQTVEYLKK